MKKFYLGFNTLGGGCAQLPNGTGCFDLSGQDDPYDFSRDYGLTRSTQAFFALSFADCLAHLTSGGRRGCAFPA